MEYLSKLLTIMLGIAIQFSSASSVDCGYKVGGPSNEDCPRMVEDDWLYLCLSKNMNCQSPYVYHCAKNDSGIWTEVCAPQQMCEKGKEPFITRQGNVVCRFCADPERYNPLPMLSNEFSYCPEKKTECSPVKDGRSRIECEDSYDKFNPYDRYTRNRKCRCNYEDDYIPYYYNFKTYNWTCSSFPEELDCYHKKCDNTEDGRKQKRGPGYRCYPVTPDVDIPSTPSNRPASTVQAPDAQDDIAIFSSKKTPSPPINITAVVKTPPSTAAPVVTSRKNQSSEPTWIYAVVAALTVIILGLSIAYLVYRYKRKKNKPPPVTNISHNYRAANNIIQVKGRQDNVNVGQHATTNYVSDVTADQTPSTTPSQRKRTFKPERKEQRPVSLNDLDDVIVHVPLAPKEETSVTPHLSTDYITPAKSDNLHNSLNRKNFTGHSRQSSESRSLVDTPFIENGRAHEQYARSASESKLNTSTGFLSSVKKKLSKMFDRKAASSSYTCLQKKLLVTPPKLKEKKKNEEGYKRVLHRLIEDLKLNMDPEAVLDGLIKYEIGRKKNHMNIKDEKHTYEKNGMILDLVETSGFEAYETFKKILVETNHIDLVEKLNEEEKRILSEVDDQSDIGSEQDGPDDSDDDAHNDNKRKPGANPHNDLNCHDSAHDNVNDSNSNDNETDHRKEEGEKRQSVNEHGVNINTRTRAGAEDKIRNGTCRKRSDEDLSEEESKAKKYLLKLEGLLWDKLVKKAKKYQEFLNKELDIPESLATHIVSRVYMEGEQSLPPAFEAHVSSPDGNCLYNSVSLILYGDERAAYRLRLAAVCNGAINSKLYIKEHNADRPNVGSMMQFMQSRLTDQSVRQLDDSKLEDLYYLAEFTIEMAVRETIKPGSYSSPLQVLFLSTAIGYTIHQYFQSGIANLYEVAPTEYHEILPSSVSERGGEGCIRILWVTQNSRHFNHIVPVIEKALTEQNQPLDRSSPVIQACRICGEPDSPDRTGIQCDQCGDWFHTDCVRLERDKLDSDADWFCPGCSDVVIEMPLSQLIQEEQESALTTDKLRGHLPRSSVLRETVMKMADD